MFNKKLIRKARLIKTINFLEKKLPPYTITECRKNALDETIRKPIFVFLSIYSQFLNLEYLGRLYEESVMHRIPKNKKKRETDFTPNMELYFEKKYFLNNKN